MTNWPEKIASDLANAFDGVPVYSNVDPNREYNGGKSIEFNVQRLQTVPTLSGAVFYDFQLVGACRAPNFDEAKISSRSYSLTKRAATRSRRL